MEILPSLTDRHPKFDYDQWASKFGLEDTATRKEKDLWWGNEREYWLKGRFGLTGPHYFALTQATIKDATGFRMKPVWRDLDDLIYGAYDKARTTSWDLMVTKRREAGLSLTFGGIIPTWVALTHPGSTSLLTSADKTRLEEMYKDKLRVVYDGLDDYIRPGVISTRQAGYLHMGKLDTKTGAISGLDSKIVTRETVDSPTALEAYRAMHIFLDEFFLHPKADKVYRSAQASSKKGFLKVAPIVMGGSAGESSVEGQKKGAELWKNAEVIKMLTVFLPGWMGIMAAPELDESGRETGQIINFCHNGHSDQKAASEWIMKTRDNLDKLEDKSHLENFIKQYPLDIQEVFNSNAKGALPQDIIHKLNEQDRILLGNPPPIERATIVPVQNTTDSIQKHGFNILPSTTGKFKILERYNPDHFYIAGMDPIPFTSAKLNDGSDNCIAIKDVDLNRYVAYYKERAIDPDVIMENNINLQDYYGGAKVMVEANRGGVIIDQYKQRGRTDLLARRPNLLGRTFAASMNDALAWGWHKNDHTAERANAYIIDYFRKNWSEVYFKEIIEEAKNYLVDNTDLLDAIISCEIYHKQMTEKNKKTAPQETVIKKIPVIEYIGGKAVRVWREVKL
jgi:hypothetical protein